MKKWINRAYAYLDKSLGKVPSEFNEIDWKQELSPNNEKLCRHISAFANLAGGGFLAFGINNETAEIIGIDRRDSNNIVDKLASLCRDGVNPVVKIDHVLETYHSKEILLVYIQESAIKPVHIKGRSIEDSYIRSGGTSRIASRHEVGILMLNSKTPTWEELHASKLLNATEVITRLEYGMILELLQKPIPGDLQEILNWMEEEKMIFDVDGKGFYITNFGAISASKDLTKFDDLSRKSVRLIKYEGVNKVGKSKEFPGTKGYAIGFEGLIQFIQGLLQDSEVVKNAFRVETSVYPEQALRELIANMMIHQDFMVKAAGPMIEIFDDRIVFTNPGKLIPSKRIDRLIRTTPESRNEILASAFRRYNICEERGSGLESSCCNRALWTSSPSI